MTTSKALKLLENKATGDLLIVVEIDGKTQLIDIPEALSDKIATIVNNRAALARQMFPRHNTL